MLSYLKKSEHILAFDSNYRSSLWASPNEAQNEMQKFWERTDLALPSMDDEILMWSHGSEEVISRFTALDRDGAIKRGKLGPLSLSPIDQKGLSFPASLKVVDTTAAGDSFNGAYLGAKLKGEPQEQALKAGHLCASQVVQYPGAIVPNF